MTVYSARALVQGLEDLAGRADASRDASHGAAAGRVTFDDILEEVGQSGPPAILLVLGLLVASPLSGIPAASSLIGLCILLVAGQGALGRTRVHVPRRIGRMSVSRTKFRAALTRMESVSDWLDWLAGGEGRALPVGVVRVTHTGIALCALAFPILEFIPFSSSALGAMCAVTALGLLARRIWLSALGLCLMGSVSLGLPFAIFQIF